MTTLPTEAGTGWGVADPNEPTWTYGTHKRISQEASGSAWHSYTGSAPLWTYGDALAMTTETFVSASKGF